MPHGKDAKTSGPSQSTAAAAAAAAAERIPSARAEFSFLASMPATKRSVVQVDYAVIGTSPLGRLGWLEVAWVVSHKALTFPMRTFLRITCAM